MRVSSQTVAPVREPLALAEAKLHLRVEDDVTTDDALIDALVTAARVHAENFTARAFITQTWETRFDNFGTSLGLPFGSLQSVSSVAYISDGSPSLETVSSSVYDVDLFSPLGCVYRAYGQSWPTPRSERQAVRVTHVSGYGDYGTNVPAPIRQGMLLMLGDMYENRETGGVGTVAFTYQMSTTVEALLGPYRLAMP